MLPCANRELYAGQSLPEHFNFYFLGGKYKVSQTSAQVCQQSLMAVTNVSVAAQYAYEMEEKSCDNPCICIISKVTEKVFLEVKSGFQLTECPQPCLPLWKTTNRTSARWGKGKNGSFLPLYK